MSASLTVEEIDSGDLMNQALEILGASGRFSREQMERFHSLQEKKDEPATVEAEPPLLSDLTFTFAAQVPSRSKKVHLKILGFDYYEYLLPRLTELVFALYGEQAITMLETLRPQQLLMKVVAVCLDRPRRDRLKVSLLETLAHTFTTPEVEITPGFLYICPPDEILEAVWQLVEINERNFTRFWARVPHQPKRALTLIYLTSIETIETLRLRLTNFISSMKQATLDSLWPSGGASDTGTDGSSDPVLSEKKPAKVSRPSRAKAQQKSG